MVIPCYTLNSGLEEMAIRCALSYKDQVDELIITEDGGMLSIDLFELADIYIYSKDNGGFTKNVNRGWKMATGDYVMVPSSDTQLSGGRLVDLCIPGKVTSPEVTNQYIDRLAGPFWCTPKEITEQYGYLREEMHTYSSDSEYDNRMAHIFQKVPSVKIFHEMARTVSTAGVEGGVQQQKDREAYQKLIDEGLAK